MRNLERMTASLPTSSGTMASSPRSVDPINSAFNAESVQPTYEGQLVETHLFSPNLVNEFNFSTMWYATPFVNTNPTAAAALIPYTLSFLDGSFTTLGGDSTSFPRAGT
jgi:hypothetical protein